MSSTLLILVIVVAVFAAMFAFCEWIVRLRDDATTSPRGSQDEAPSLAARRRLLQRLNRDRGRGGNAE